MTYNPNELIEIPKIGMLTFSIPKIPSVNVFGTAEREDKGDVIVKGKTIIVTATTDTVDLYINGKKKTYKVTPNIPSKIIYKDDITSLHRTFYLMSNIRKVDISNLDLSNMHNVGVTMLCQNCSLLTTFIANTQNPPKNITSISGLLCNCSQLVNVDLSTWNFNNVNENSMGFRGCVKLINLKFGKNLKVSISFADSPLTHESALSVLNGLAEVTTPLTVTFKASTYNTLTEEEIALATSKGWNIASA